MLRRAGLGPNRQFIKGSYAAVKKANPDIPILIREAVGTPARAFARFGQSSLSLSGYPLCWERSWGRRRSWESGALKRCYSGRVPVAAAPSSRGPQRDETRQRASVSRALRGASTPFLFHLQLSLLTHIHLPCQACAERRDRVQSTAWRRASRSKAPSRLKRSSKRLRACSSSRPTGHSGGGAKAEHTLDELMRTNMAAQDLLMTPPACLLIDLLLSLSALTTRTRRSNQERVKHWGGGTCAPSDDRERAHKTRWYEKG